LRRRTIIVGFAGLPPEHIARNSSFVYKGKAVDVMPDRTRPTALPDSHKARNGNEFGRRPLGTSTSDATRSE
jgi:hypothetical protein